MRKKQQWIMVMSKAPAQQEFGCSISFSIDILGAKEAIKKAHAYIDEESKLFKDIEFKIQGGEW